MGLKEIPLTQGYTALVDDDDYGHVAAFKWTLMRGPRTNYAYRALVTNGVRETIYMHRVIMGAGPGEVVDHRNWNGLHNWRDNLRLCTRQQNGRYRKAAAETDGRTSQYLGVSMNSKSGRWYAFIQLGDRRSRFLGSFERETDAAMAYDVAAVEHFGEFAHINLPRKTG